MFNSLRVTAEEYIVHSLKSSSALIEIKLHGTQCLAPAHWEIICKPQLSVLLLILMDEALEPSPRCNSPSSSSRGAYTDGFLPMNILHLLQAGRASLGILDIQHCSFWCFFAALTLADAAAAFPSRPFASLTAQLIPQGDAAVANKI